MSIHVLDLGLELPTHDMEFAEMASLAGKGRVPPIRPDTFGERLRLHVDSGVIKFTNKVRCALPDS